MFISILCIGLLTTFAWSHPLMGKESHEKTKMMSPVLFHKGVDFAKEFTLDLVKYNPNLYAVSGNANDYADKLLVKLQEFIRNNYDPLELGENNELKWMKVEGLTSIYRSGDATITHKGLQIIFEANLGVRELKGSAFFEKHLWWVFWISGIGYADITGIKMYGVINIKIDQSIKPHLDTFSITDWGHMDVHLDGQNWIGDIVEFFSGIFPSILSNYLKNNLPGMVQDGINQVLDSVDIDIGALGRR